MGKVYAELDERLAKYISRQPVFFVATAPCLTEDGEGGHVNLSPKGYKDTFAVLGPRAVAYVDLTGSGAPVPRGARVLPRREQRGQHRRPARAHERRSFATRRSGTISTLNGLRARNVSLPLTSAATV